MYIYADLTKDQSDRSTMCQAGRMFRHGLVTRTLNKILRPQKLAASTMSGNQPIVELSPGSYLAGKVLPVPGAARPVHAYLGIPYARPPVGSLRFRRPEPLTDPSWRGVRDATEFGAICPQPPEAARIAFSRYPLSETMSEDCLFLNVFTPRPPGGHDVTGSSDIYDGRMLAGRHDVIVVTMNYRLGILGFLSSPDGHLPGNLGLLDQLEALRWVQKNVGKFGGDKDNVTIFGESAGAISVSLHMVSPLARGLFHRAICQSGTAAYESVVRSKEGTGKFLLSALKPYGMESIDGREVERFLNAMTTEELSSRFLKQFGIVVDDYYLPGHPIDLYSRGLSHPGVDMMCGFNTHEGILIISMFVGQASVTTREEAEAFIKGSLGQVEFRGNPQVRAITDLAAAEYLKECTDPDRLWEQCTATHADCLFTAPTVRAASDHSAHSRTFMYEFRHRPYFSRLPGWVVSDHTDEIPYVFGEPLAGPQERPAADRAVSDTVMTYWTNFAKTGDPNSGTSTQWPTYNQQTKQYLRLKQSPDVASDYKPQQMALWNNDVMKLARGQMNKL